MPGGVGLVETRRAALFGPDRPFELATGGRLDEVEVAYETYGELNADRSNAVFITPSRAMPMRPGSTKVTTPTVPGGGTTSSDRAGRWTQTVSS